MDMGIGFSEILVILTLILVFFGSGEILQLIRMTAKLTAKIKYYSDKVKVEIGNISRSFELTDQNNSIYTKKEKARENFLIKRKSQSIEERIIKSEKIAEYLINCSYFKEAKSILIYINIGSEVETRACINQILKLNKRVVIPYITEDENEIRIAEIYDLERDTVKGRKKLLLPNQLTANPFLKADLQLVVCPGIAFDSSGVRLCRKGSRYNRFLKDLKGTVPLIGLAFDCQISNESLLFDYRDTLMDQVITESGFLIKTN